MVKGIGTDILQVSKLYDNYLGEEDAFIQHSFTGKELEEARQRIDRKQYLAGRFCGKEAVYKALNRNPQMFQMKDIEILSKENGQPYVTLYAESKEQAEQSGITQILLSLSHEEDYVIAYAIALGE